MSWIDGVNHGTPHLPQKLFQKHGFDFNGGLLEAATVSRRSLAGCTLLHQVAHGFGPLGLLPELGHPLHQTS